MQLVDQTSEFPDLSGVRSAIVFCDARPCSAELVTKVERWLSASSDKELEPWAIYAGKFSADAHDLHDDRSIAEGTDHRTVWHDDGDVERVVDYFELLPSWLGGSSHIVVREPENSAYQDAIIAKIGSDSETSR